MKQLLFLCTGNYYRSRFAEIYFNWQAPLRGLDWRAESRGLALDPRNVGPLSRYTIECLSKLSVSCTEHLRAPMGVTEADFTAASRVIALKEAEHRPLVETNFAAWADRVEYWNVHDLDCAMPDVALSHLEREITALLATLQTKAA